VACPKLYIFYFILFQCVIMDFFVSRCAMTTNESVIFKKQFFPPLGLRKLSLFSSLDILTEVTYIRSPNLTKMA
jgi:hypothetical protein